MFCTLCHVTFSDCLFLVTCFDLVVCRDVREHCFIHPSCVIIIRCNLARQKKTFLIIVFYLSGFVGISDMYRFRLKLFTYISRIKKNPFETPKNLA